MQPTYKHTDWQDHARQVDAYKYNLSTPHYLDLSGYAPDSLENRRYSKNIDAGSRRALTSQPGKRSRKSRLASGSAKGKYQGRSEKDAFEENPYTSGLGETTQHPFREDDEANLINITTEDHLNKTDSGIYNNLLSFSYSFRYAG